MADLIGGLGDVAIVSLGYLAAMALLSLCGARGSGFLLAASVGLAGVVAGARHAVKHKPVERPETT